jgi:hypothetical protein
MERQRVRVWNSSIAMGAWDVIIFKATWSATKGIVLFVIGLIRLPFDLLFRFLREER